MSKLKTLALAASLSLTAAFTLSCSSDDGEEGGGGGGVTVGPSTQVFNVKNIESDYIVINDPNRVSYECSTENGFKTKANEDYIYYSIDNKVLTLWNDIELNGTTDTIIGTWNRSINKAASCKDHYYEEEYEGYWCDSGYDITQLVVTDQNVSVTRNICPTDEIKNGEDWGNGYIARVKNCTDYTISKGSTTISVHFTESLIKITYNGKSCQRDFSGGYGGSGGGSSYDFYVELSYDGNPPSGFSVNNLQAACNKAISDCQNNGDCSGDAYWDYFDNIFDDDDDALEKCIEGLNLPSDFPLGGGEDEGGSDESDAGAPLRKSLAKPQAKNFLNLPNAKSKRF
jgi:hypothetical protein